ncbi:MAG: hypothetical protein KDE54_35155, partial [Caldilineaceae bacterium]|nr:hypothetical protein [Caldilineaceae bacterium]MCB0140573.1 hypothetical protein [Caldilineaceae bacterium]
SVQINRSGMATPVDERVLIQRTGKDRFKETLTPWANKLLFHWLCCGCDENRSFSKRYQERSNHGFHTEQGVDTKRQQ